MAPWDAAGDADLQRSGGRRRGGGDRVVAAWEPVEAPGVDGLLHLPPESCVVLADG